MTHMRAIAPVILVVVMEGILEEATGIQVEMVEVEMVTHSPQQTHLGHQIHLETHLVVIHMVLMMGLIIPKIIGPGEGMEDLIETKLLPQLGII